MSRNTLRTNPHSTQQASACFLVPIMKVSILDDSRTDSYLASKVAQQFFDVVEVHGLPGDFRAALRKEPLPDLILMDVHIGDLHNGIAELATIKDQYNEASLIPIVVVTASADEAMHAFAQSQGAHAVIVKPITVEKLQAVIADLLPAHQAGQA